MCAPRVKMEVYRIVYVPQVTSHKSALKKREGEKREKKKGW